MMDDTDEGTFEAGWNARGPAIILDSRIAQLEAALLHDRTVIERVIRDEQGSQWLLDTLTAIDRVLGEL